MIASTLTNNSLILSINNKSFVINKEHPKWNEILDIMRSSVPSENDLLQLISLSNKIENFTEGNIVVEDNSVFFKGHPLAGLDVDRLLDYVENKVPIVSLCKFLERKMKNPSKRAIDEMYKFLEHKKMPLTPDGKVVGYKGVRDDYYSVTGNINSVILQGTVDESGHILNKPGETIRMLRSCVDDDFREGCSTGLHVGSLEYALSWGVRVVKVIFDPEDVVSVPSDSNHQKLRTCAYTVDSEYVRDEVINNSFTESCKKQERIEVNTDDINYNDGYELGLKDGKGHSKRKYYVTDESNDNTPSNLLFISGYNKGYAKGRYNKD